MANKPRLVRGIISELNVYGADTPVVYCVSSELDTSATIHATFEAGFLLQTEDKEYVFEDGQILVFNDDTDVEELYQYAEICNAKPKACVRICL